MRIIVTPLLSRGIARPTRAAPIVANMRSAWDEQHRHVLQLSERQGSAGNPPRVLWHQLYFPQLAEARERAMVFHGYEIENSQMFVQAWEVEADRR